MKDPLPWRGRDCSPNTLYEIVETWYDIFYSIVNKHATVIAKRIKRICYPRNLKNEINQVKETISLKKSVTQLCITCFVAPTCYYHILYTLHLCTRCTYLVITTR